MKPFILTNYLIYICPQSQKPEFTFLTFSVELKMFCLKGKLFATLNIVLRMLHSKANIDLLFIQNNILQLPSRNNTKIFQEAED